MPLPWTPVIDNVDDVTADHVNTLYDIAEKSAALAYFVNTETLAGTKTLVDADAGMQYLDPGGAARDVVLPAEAVGNHIFWITNTADAAETLTVKNDAAGVIGTVAVNECKTFISNGVAWRALTNTATGSLVKITETILSVAAASVTWASIPATYKSLQIIINGRVSGAVNTASININFNSDFGNNYDYQTQYSIVATLTAQEAYGAALMSTRIVGANAPAGVSSITYIDIADYAGTTFNKACDTRASIKFGTSANSLWTYRSSGFWRNTAAIDTIRLYSGSGNFEIGSTFSLYGIP